MQQIYLELRDAEGGKDAKLLVEDMASIYLRAAELQQFKSKVIS